MTTLIFFNLLANATFSFWVGILIVAAAIKVFRVQTGPWKLSLLLLPFVKVLFDFFSGVPTDSILMKSIDPFKVAPGLQSISLGLGVDYWGPVFQLMFLVRDPSKNLYGASAGDYIYYWLAGKSVLLPVALLLLAVSVSVILLARRWGEALRFESIRRKDRKNSHSLKEVQLRFRKVDIYLSKTFLGTPFTGGIFKPYICIPENTHNQMSEEETKAVIAHELAHIRQFDIVFTMFIQILGDVFWFIPGYRICSRKIDRMREVIADQLAVASGVQAEQLASALLKLKEIPDVKNKFILYSAFTRESSLLKLRVHRLLGQEQEPTPRLGWGSLVLRMLLTVWIAGAVINSTLAGNHTRTLYAPEEAFERIQKFLQSQLEK